MPKHKRHSDKLYLNASEASHLASERSGKCARTTGVILPLHWCGFSLTIADEPAIAVSGIIFEKKDLIDFVRKHGKDPASGEKAIENDIVSIHIENPPLCSLSGKSLISTTLVVVNRKNGMVYERGSLLRAVTGTSPWRDPCDDEPFTKEDLIVLQNPDFPETRDSSKFYWRKKMKEESFKGKKVKNFEKVDLSECLPLKEVERKSHSQKIYAKHINRSEIITEVQTDAKHIENRAYISIDTNIGILNFELFQKEAPVNVKSFIDMCKSNILKGCEIRKAPSGAAMRLPESFCKEIGCPQELDRPGSVSVAERRLLIAFAAAPHLAAGRTVFGRIVKGLAILQKSQFPIIVRKTSVVLF